MAASVGTPLSVNSGRGQLPNGAQSPVSNEKLQENLSGPTRSPIVDAQVQSPTVNQQSEGGISKLKADLDRFLNENKTLTAIYDNVAPTTGLKRKQLNYGFAGGLAGLLSLYLLIGSGASFVCNFLIGAVYPITASLNALRTQDKSKNTQLLVYWTLFGVLLIADSILSEVSAYFLFKAIGLLILSLPQLNGSEVIFTRIINPALNLVDSPKSDLNNDEAAKQFHREWFEGKAASRRKNLPMDYNP